MPTGKERAHHGRFLIHPFVALFDAVCSNFSSRAIYFDFTEHLMARLIPKSDSHHQQKMFFIGIVLDLPIAQGKQAGS